MQYVIGTAGDALDPHLPCGRMQQGQQFRRATAYIFMRIASRLALGLPAMPWLWDSLIGTGFLFIPYGKSQARRRLVRLLD